MAVRFGKTCVGSLCVVFQRDYVPTESDRKLMGAIASAIGVEEGRRQMEKTLQEKARELQKSNEMKDLFSDIMHHDLLNPLGSAGINVELLLEDDTVKHRKEELERVDQNLKRAMRLIEMSARMSKLQDTDELELRDTDLAEVVEEVVESFDKRAASAGVKIENRVEGGMAIKGNEIIEEVFSNLIANALKYAKDGTKVIIDKSDADGSWRVKVVDFGPGIKDEYKEGIFNRFERKGKKGVRGSGLGLSISRRIVELHGGKIWVEDTPEGGATFMVELPKN